MTAQLRGKSSKLLVQSHVMHLPNYLTREDLLSSPAVINRNRNFFPPKRFRYCAVEAGDSNARGPKTHDLGTPDQARSDRCGWATCEQKNRRIFGTAPQ